MRVYHFLSASNALDDISNRYLKISEIDKLNDPFELWCSAQPTKEVREVLRSWKTELAQRFGMICFSRRWHNPVLWSHYAERHQGICLGFDVMDEGLKAVAYVDNRLPLRLPPSQADMEQLMFTKFRDWQYEEEWRGWFSLEDRDASGHYFFKLDDKIRLREVIAGPLCTATKASIETAIADYSHSVEIVKARLAFTKFQVVANRNGFRL